MRLTSKVGPHMVSKLEIVVGEEPQFLPAGASLQAHGVLTTQQLASFRVSDLRERETWEEAILFMI